MLAMLHDLQTLIEHKEETALEGLENEMLFYSGVEQEIMNIFQELLNQARCQTLPGTSLCLVCETW